MILKFYILLITLEIFFIFVNIVILRVVLLDFFFFKFRLVTILLCAFDYFYTKSAIEVLNIIIIIIIIIVIIIFFQFLEYDPEFRCIFGFCQCESFKYIQPFNPYPQLQVAHVHAPFFSRATDRQKCIVLVG